MIKTPVFLHLLLATVLLSLSCQKKIDEPDDPFKITSAPMFVAPGTGQIDLNTVEGYQLRPNSPAIGAGKVITGNGDKDYFGLPVSASDPPNIGFYNGAGVD